MIWKKNLHWLICLLFVGSCAKQVAPTGGPKDTIPPVLVRSIPSNEAINFKGKSLIMEFSEMVELNNPKEQLIIIPSVGKDYDIKVKKNAITLNIANELEDSTTYTFNFRDAIRDVTEKNPAKNIQVAISTGPYIDSLSIEGKIFDLIKSTETNDATVAIHLKNDTFSIFKHPANIFTKTNKKGIFKIDNLKPADYFIYAFEDKNRNLVVDSKTEYYGFLRDSIHLVNDTSKVSLGLIRLDARPLKLTSSRPYNTYFLIKATKNLSDFKLTTKTKNDLFYSYGEDHSSIKVFNTIQEGDSLALDLAASDSIGNKLDTTLYAKFPKREVTPEKFDASVENSIIYADKGELKYSLKFTKPLKEINFDSLLFEVDSAINITFTKDDLLWDQPTNTLKISKKVDKAIFQSEKKPEKKEEPKNPKNKKEQPQKKKVNRFYAARGTFISIENDSSKTITKPTTPLKAEDLSQIIFEFKTQEKKTIVQLLNSGNDIIQTLINKPKGQFDDLPSGDYIIRLIIDKNGNGKWDPGNYYKRDEPETMIYYKDEKGAKKINLKSNWELVLTPMWITSAKSVNTKLK